MRIFSFLNVLLLLVVMATHEGAHLDGLLSPSQQKWLHEGGKVLMTGQMDKSTVTAILKSAKANATKAYVPDSITAPTAATFDFAAEGRGGNNPAAVAAPANYTMPAAAPVDVDQAFTAILASLQNS